MIRDEGYRMYNQSNIKVSYEDIVTLMEYLEDNYLINSEFISYFKDRYLDLPKLRAEEKEAYKLIQKFIEKTKMDMVFVTIDKEYTHKQVEDYACDFYDYNDFGIDFENYSGLILVRNINTYADGNKYYYIAAIGLAQLYYADGGRMEDILDDIYDDFVSENYVEGIEKLVDDSIYYFEKGYENKFKNAFIDETGHIRYTYHVPYVVCGIASSIITLITMIILVSKNKKVKKAITANQYINKDSINLYKNEKGVFVENKVTMAKRMKQIPPIIEIDFSVILRFSFILIYYKK